MKKIMVLLFLLLMVIPVFAETENIPSANVWPEKITVLDISLQLSFTAVALADTFQTYCALHHGGFQEMNPILGHHPTDFELFTLSGSAIIIHTFIAYLLPQPWRFLWQMVWISVESYMVINNWSVGARFQY